MTASERETAQVEPEIAPREGLAAIVGGYFERLRAGEVGIAVTLDTVLRRRQAAVGR